MADCIGNCPGAEEIGVSNGFAVICEHASCACIFRTRAVIKFVLQAASTSENTDSDQRALGKFSASWNLSFIK